MAKNRLEAFSDGVLAIIITVMVLELKRPDSAEFWALWALSPVLLSYVLSFVYVGIYWNNHHHLLHATKRVNGRILWANLHLLFWISLFPFATAWMGENHVKPAPTIVYGFVLLMAAIAWYVLQSAIMADEGSVSVLRRALGSDWKGRLSPLIYVGAITLAFVSSWIAIALYSFVAVLWLVPDRRIERALRDHQL
jgi:TMEM175 potassium channel family protein